MYRNVGDAGISHQRLQKKRRSQRGSQGPAGASRSLAADPDAVAAAQASLDDEPIARTKWSKPPRITDLSEPIARYRAEKIANRILGEEPITSAMPTSKRLRPTHKGTQ